MGSSADHPTSPGDHCGPRSPQRKLGALPWVLGGWPGLEAGAGPDGRVVGTENPPLTLCSHICTPTPLLMHARVCAQPRSLTRVCKHVHTHTPKQAPGRHDKGRGLSGEPDPPPSCPHACT